MHHSISKRNRKLKISKMPLKSQAKSTSLFTSNGANEAHSVKGVEIYQELQSYNAHSTNSLKWMVVIFKKLHES